MGVEAANSGGTIVDQARTGIAGAIKQAANATGASFEYLLTTAKMESNFNPSAQATTSSAKGLFQFIEQTWLGTVKEAGGALGFGQYADAISKSDSGSYSVSDPAARKAIMDLRNDPAISSAMAGVLTQSNSFKLTGEIGRRPSDAELYMAHFMGVNGAAKLINNATDNPNAIGATLFPNAAAANAPIFYDQSGNPRTVAQVYANLSARYDAAAGSSATKSAMASVGVSTNSPVSLASAAQPSDADAAYLSGFPDIRNVTPASGASSASGPVNGTSAAAQRSNEPMFRTLFIGGDRSEAVSPAVAHIWNGNQAPAQGAPTLSRTPDVRPPSPLDLFSDRSGTFAG